jgi:hypothetical protein
MRAASWLLLAGGLAAPLAGRAAALPSLEEEVLAWRAGRLERLMREDGWLTLVGLHWLEDGRNEVGSDAGNDVVLPAGPAHAGTLVVADGKVRLEPIPGAGLEIDGEPAAAMDLASDLAGDPTVVSLGSRSFHVIDRGGHLLLRVKDSNAPSRRDFQGLDYYPVDPAWRFDARFEVYDPPRLLRLADVTGLVQEQPSWGAVVFEKDGVTYRLDVASAAGAEELFLIFGDRTNGQETYGAGRYLYVPAPDAEGRIPLDFNRAYSPPCAFTPYATCPLPPPQNRLPLRVTAGEKTYRGAH